MSEHYHLKITVGGMDFMGPRIDNYERAHVQREDFEQLVNVQDARVVYDDV